MIPDKAASTLWRKLFFSIAGVISFIVFIEVWGKTSTYLNWKTLSKKEVVKEAKIYIKNRIRISGSACLYVVDCTQGAARLRMVNSLADWDLDADRAIIWKRRFSKFCEGRVTNIGLAFVPSEQSSQTLELTNHSLSSSNTPALWNFYRNEFIPSLGRFHSGSFSQPIYEKCTLEKAIVSVSIK